MPAHFTTALISTSPKNFAAPRHDIFALGVLRSVRHPLDAPYDMVRSVLFEAIFRLFEAAHLALHRSSKVVVLHSRARHRYGIYLSNEALELFLRLDAILRLECIEKPDVILLPWKEDTALRDIGLLERTPRRSTSSHRRAPLFSPITINALRMELERPKENSLSRIERLVKYRNEIQEQIVQRYEDSLGTCSITPAASPLTASPRSLVHSPKIPPSRSSSHSVENPKTPSNSSTSDIQCLHTENEKLWRQFQSSPKQQCLSPLSLSEVTASPTDGNTDIKLDVQHDMHEIKVQASKVSQLRSRARRLEAEVEEHRLYKAQVRDWACRFVQEKNSEKAALVEHLRKAQTTNAELRATVARQGADIEALRSELVETTGARAEAETQLGAVRAHHEALAEEISARNAELSRVQQEMLEARDTYVHATKTASGEIESCNGLVRSLRAEVSDLKFQAQSLMAQRDELQRSLANMTYLANTAQRLITVARELVAERARKAAVTVKPITTSSPPSSSRKKKDSDRETQLYVIRSKI